MIFVFYWGQFTVIQLTVAQNPNDSFISQRIRIDQEILDNNTKISKDKCPNLKYHRPISPFLNIIMNVQVCMGKAKAVLLKE